MFRSVNHPLKYLFIDFNAYFAGVEQLDHPHLRGKPVLVTPLKSEHSSAIAASYEARPFGVKRGTLVREARQLCPGIAVMPARHDRYVKVHKELKAEVERHLPITKVYSIDEWTCLLSPSERTPGAAKALGARVQQGILRNVGASMRSSIGVAPSRLLAKLAAESHKPDGLTVLEMKDLPHRFADMPLIKIPGIGNGVLRRLERVGVTDFVSLWHLEPKHARKIWGSVQGERFWYALHGFETHEEDTPERRMIGHSRVLSTPHGKPDKAKIVARALLMKAASRLRHDGLFAGGMSLGVRMRGGHRREGAESRRVSGGRWERSVRFAYTQDTYHFSRELDRLWQGFLQAGETLRDGNGGHRLGNITVYLHHLAAGDDMAVQQADLFTNPAEKLQDQKRSKLWRAIDVINADLEKKMTRLGTAAGRAPDAGRYITLAAQAGLDLEYLGGKIAFGRIPREEEFLY
jgi:DNA polymerase-4